MARPEISQISPSFTTRNSALRIVEKNEFNSSAVADIPGIIEGASGGKGLGIKFLKHIERTKSLLLLIDIVQL